MNNKHYVGRAVKSIEHYDSIGPITGVSLIVDEDNEYIAGDMTGYVFEATCPYGTQAMANDMLASLQGKVYNGFRATDAILDISTELGDGVTIDGIYAMLAYQEITFGPKHTSEIAAPGESVLEHEYPYVGSTQKNINRKIAQVNSRITKTAEEIRLEVSNELDSLSSSINVKLDGITLETIGADGKVSSVKLFDTGKIDLTGYATFTGLSGGTTTIDGGCIKTGTIDAERLNLTGAITFGDLDANLQQTIEDAGSVDLPSYIKSTYIDSTEIKSPTITGNDIAVYNTFQTIGYDGVNAVVTGYMGATLGQDAYGNDTLGVALSNAWSSGNPGSKYVIVTNGGARMQGGSNSVVVTASGAELSYDSGTYKIRVDSNGCRWYDGSWHDIGSGGSAETVTVVPVWG